MPNFYLDQNGLKHYTDKLRQEFQSSQTGVTSFNGREGEVISVSGDYTVSMIPGAVPNTRTVNGKPLSSDITLNASDIGVETPDLSGYVPTTRTVNGKPLNNNITLSATDVNSLPISGGTLSGNLTIKNSDNYGTKLALGDGDYVHISEPVDDCMEIKANKVNFVLSDTTDSKFTINNENPFGAAVGSYVPTSRTVNGKALSNDISLNSDDIGISSSSGGQIRILGRTAYPDTIAIGKNSSAVEYNSIAIGYAATCPNGSDCIAIGKNCVSAKGSIVIGSDSSSFAKRSIVIGPDVVAADNNDYNEECVAIGYRINSNATMSVCIGQDSSVSGNISVAIGAGAIAKASAIAIGASNAIGINSTAIGIGANAAYSKSIAIGYDSISNGAYSVSLGAYSNVGAVNSASIGPYSECYEQKTIQLGNASFLSKLSCKVALSVTSDERDKTDITPIGDGAVDFLNKIKAIRYVFNGRELYIADDENLSDVDKVNRSKYGMCSYDKEAHALGTKKGERVRVGVLAQEVQKALQEVYGDASYANLVDDNFFDLDKSTIPEGVENKLTMTYENFIPFLIKAIQELSQKNEEMEQRLYKLENK